MPGEPASLDPQPHAIAFPIALGLSLALHAGLGVALAMGGFGDGSDPEGDSFFEEFSTDPDRPDPRFVALGNPDSRVASLTWIGYDEFEEMWAPPSEVDQALQDPNEPGDPTALDQPIEDPADELAAAEPDPPQPLEDPVNEPDESLVLVTPEDASTIETVGEIGPPDYTELLELLDAIEGLAADIPPFNPVEALESLRTSRTADRTQAPPAEVPSNPATPTAEVVAEREPEKPPVSGQSGQRADREADAAAVKPVKNADLGKPLAAEGLSIRTVRPVFSNVTLATARPSNPVVRIDFRRNGKPIRVVFIKSSGHAQVDIEVRKALFKWRASGNALSQLPDPEDPNTPAYVSVKLEILL